MPITYFCILSRLFRVTKKLVHHRQSIKEVVALAAVFSLNLRSVRRNITVFVSACSVVTLQFVSAKPSLA